MKPFFFTLSLLSPVLTTTATGAEASQKDKRMNEPEKPNVILIYADDLGYGDLSCYGAQGVRTPNVDRLAAKGIRFTDMHAVAATSTPSRYSLLTGEYAWRRPDTDIANGDAAMIIQPWQYTLADMFKHTGYTTAVFGKWHLGLGNKSGEQDWNAPLAATPADLGFDHHYIMAATADRVPCVFIEDGCVANYDASAPPIEVSYKQNFAGEPTGKAHPELLYNLKPAPKHGHDQSIVNGISRIGYMKGGGQALWKDENIADSITLHATQFIREHHNKPFFIYFATNDVHVPRFPHPRFRGKSTMGLRGDAIVQFDWCVGQIMQTLDELGISDNTLIILSSDNGPVVNDGYQDQAEELLGNHKPSGPLRGYKYSAYEGGTRVPAIACWPKYIKPQSESDALMSQIDWMASLAALIDARLPKGSAPDSHNYLEELLGKKYAGRPWVIEQAANHTLSVRTPKWKYIEANDGPTMTWGSKVETGNCPTPQLYNMKNDVYEQENVATQHPETVFELESILRKVRAQKTPL